MVTWNPRDYAGNSQQQQAWARELIAKLRLSGSEDLLDIGCGDGKVTAEIAQHLPRGSVVGIDASPDMIAFAAEAFPPARHPNLRFAIGDAAALPFSAAFDVVFSNACLHWVYDHRPVLSGIHRALRPGGRALLQMGGTGNAARMLCVLESLMGEKRWREHFAGFGFRYGFHAPDDYQVWLADAGLTPQRMELIPKPMEHTPASLAGWFRTTWMPYINAVPEAMRASFVEEVIARYIAQNPLSPSGTTTLMMMRLEVECAAARG